MTAGFNKPTQAIAKMQEIKVMIKKLPGAEDLPLPRYMTPHAAGVDLLAAVDKETILAPGESTLIPTGIAIALPDGFEAQVRPRSGLAFKHGVTLLNAPGTIDADYRGEIGVILINLGQVPFAIERGDRIAQMIISSCTRAEFQVTDNLPDSHRGTGGFGSTGKS